MTELENLAYRAKEILGSKIADLTELEAKAFWDLQKYFETRKNDRDFSSVSFDKYVSLRLQAYKLAEALEVYDGTNPEGLDWDLVNNPAAIQDRGGIATAAVSEWKKFLETNK